MKHYDYIVLKTIDEALEYLESIKNTIDEDIYNSAKDRLQFDYNINKKKMTVKMMHDFITILELGKQGKYKEADKKTMEFAVENMNIYLKEEGIIK